MSQLPSNPYSMGTVSPPPRPSGWQGPPPEVLKWQIVYLVFMVVIYLLFAALGIFFFANADMMAAEDADMEAAEFRIMGGIYGVMGAGLALLFAGGIVVRRGMVGWVYNLVLIGIGLTSCCFWPATIPLVIFWVKAKDYVVGPA